MRRRSAESRDDSDVGRSFLPPVLGASSASCVQSISWLNRLDLMMRLRHAPPACSLCVGGRTWAVSRLTDRMRALLSSTDNETGGTQMEVGYVGLGSMGGAIA